ncbi:hypothetical protein M513_09154 [Trichuris suis]|uniref:Uncharacterized protein n=1 Tax=Trichuris suis TaxID=68888 RepID=A0A085LY94_9BILA|nr:hypothetical protein M513_09154 [Trichuris suis]
MDLDKQILSRSNRHPNRALLGVVATRSPLRLVCSFFQLRRPHSSLGRVKGPYHILRQISKIGNISYFTIVVVHLRNLSLYRKLQYLTGVHFIAAQLSCYFSEPD